MHRSAVTCRICHQKYFPASLKFHLKVCATKLEHINLPCDYCQEQFSCTALQTHMKICARGRNRQAPARRRGRDNLSLEDNTSCSRGHSDSSFRQQRAAAARLTPADKDKMTADDLVPASYTWPIGKGVDRAQSGRGVDNSRDEDGEVASGMVAQDGRIACANCQRKFSSDRVGIHHEICQRVNRNNAVDDNARGRKMFKMRTMPAIQTARRSSCPAAVRKRAVLSGHGGDRSRHPTLIRAADTMCISTHDRTTGLDAKCSWVASSGASQRAPGATLPGPINHGTSTTFYYGRGSLQIEEQPEARGWSISRGSVPPPRPYSAVDWTSASAAAAAAAGCNRRTSGRGSSSWSPVRRNGRNVGGSSSLSNRSIWPITVRGRGYAAVAAAGAAGGSVFSCWGGGDDGKQEGVLGEGGLGG